MKRLKQRFALFLSAAVVFATALPVWQAGAADVAGMQVLVDLDMGAAGDVLPDRSGNGYDAVVVANGGGTSGIFREPLNGDLTYSAAYGRRIEWNGNNTTKAENYIGIGDIEAGTSLSEALNGAATIDMLVKVPSDGNAGGVLFSCNGGAYRIDLMKSGDNYQIWFYREYEDTTQSAAWIASTNAEKNLIKPDTWTHVLIAFDSQSQSKPQVWLNNTSVDITVTGNRNPGSQPKDVSGNPVLIGNIYTKGDAAYQYNRTFRGSVAGMRLFDGIPTEAQRNAIYQESLSVMSGQFDPRLYDAGGSLIAAESLQAVPVDMGSIQVEVLGDAVVDEDSVNDANIRLESVVTGSVYPCNGFYDPQSRTYHMDGFGMLQYGMAYRLVMENITTADGTVLNPQTLSFTVQPGVAFDSVELSGAAGEQAVHCVVANHLDTEQSVLLIAAVYHDGVLQQVAAAESVAVTAGGSEELDCTLSWDTAGEDDEIRLFLSDGLGALNAYAEPYVVQ